MTNNRIGDYIVISGIAGAFAVDMAIEGLEAGVNAACRRIADLIEGNPQMRGLPGTMVVERRVLDYLLANDGALDGSRQIYETQRDELIREAIETRHGIKLQDLPY